MHLYNCDSYIQPSCEGIKLQVLINNYKYIIKLFMHVDHEMNQTFRINLIMMWLCVIKLENGFKILKQIIELWVCSKRCIQHKLFFLSHSFWTKPVESGACIGGWFSCEFWCSCDVDSKRNDPTRSCEDVSTCSPKNRSCQLINLFRLSYYSLRKYDIVHSKVETTKILKNPKHLCKPNMLP